MPSTPIAKRIAFLACPETLPGPGARRGDAFEHDLEVAALRPAFAAAGFALVEMDWRSPVEMFEGVALALLGTAWDYQDHAEEFIAKLELLETTGVTICNSSDVVRWNADKRYLRDLEQAGATIVPTLWIEDAGRADILDAMEKLGSDDVVIKRQVGAGGIGQHRFTRETLPEPTWRMGRPAMVQPFLPSILEEGEYTFVFIGGAFSHGVRKCAGSDEYRIQSLFGGYEEACSPSPGDLETAQSVVAALPFANLLYCRIDMIRLPSGELAVMEAEAIEPYLYPEQGPQLGERLARAVAKRLGG